METDEVKTELEIESLEDFLARNADRCKEWMRHHREHQKFPVIKLDGKWIWLNRKQRRNLK